MAALSTAFNLSPTGNIVYKLHPVVVFSILDHYKRRKELGSRVVGTLLGEPDVANGIIYITNCFPVQHKEGNDELQYEKPYHDEMFKLYQRVNPKEKVIGWYTTGNEISYISSLIHGWYTDQVRKPLKEAVHLTVDVDLGVLNMSIRAYTGYTLHKVNGRDVLARYEQAILELHATSGEKIGVDALISGQPENINKLDSPATILSDVDNLYKSMSKLVEMISVVQQYCQRAYEKRDGFKADPEVARLILEALEAVPTYQSTENLSAVFNENIDDMLMITYLANFTRTQAVLLNKINVLMGQ